MVEYQDQVVGVVPSYDMPPQNKKKKNPLASKILGFIAMALSIISIPMLFLPTVSAVLVGSFNIVQIKDLADFVGLTSYFVGILIYFIALMVIAAVSAIFDIFKNKGCKITACIFSAIAFVMSVVVLILIFVKGKSLVSPGIGIWMNTSLLLVAFILSLIAAIMAPKKNAEPDAPVIVEPPIGGGNIEGTAILEGKLVFTSGSCAGYEIPVKPGARIVIGKDPSRCSVVIDKSYTKVSRAHCSVEYDSMQDIYIVTDMSTNGTNIVGGPKLQSGSPSYLQRGTVINLAGTDNTFRLD